VTDTARHACFNSSFFFTTTYLVCIYKKVVPEILRVSGKGFGLKLGDCLFFM
jgi:hypothetical protein